MTRSDADSLQDRWECDGLVVSGTLSLDTLHLPSGVHNEVPGGSALYAGLGASLVGRCAVVGSVGPDFPDQILASLSERDIDVSGVSRRQEPTFRWTARYAPDLDERETLERMKGAGRSAPTLPNHLAGDGICLLLGSMAPGHQRAVLAQAGADTRYGIDTMAHWINEEADALLGLVRGASVVFVSQDECALLGQDPDPFQAAQALVEDGTALVVLKTGSQGAYLIQKSAPPLHCPAVPASIVDPTGAGDALAGAFLAALSSRLSPALALARGMAAAAIALEGVSCSGFATRSATFEARVQWALRHLEPDP